MDDINHLRTVLLERAELQESDLAPIFDKCILKQYNKGELIIKEGIVEGYMSFIVEGMVRVFFYRDGKEFSLDFFFPGSFVSSYESFLIQSPSTLNVEALATTTLVRIHYDDLQKIFTINPKVERFVKVMTEEIFRRLSERVQDLLSLSASDRYEKLLETNPQYVQMIPLKLLATYLNVTPESLSRIRKGKTDL